MNLLDRLLEHDRWTTRQVFIVCRTLTLEQLQKPFELGQGTIDETLRHMIRNVQVWTDLMRTRPVQPREPITRAGIEELAALFEVIYTDFAEYARRLQADDRLDELYLDVLDEPPTPKSFGGTIAHVITHNMHHRAELLHMLGRFGVPNLPEGDVLVWEMLARGQEE